MTAQAPATPPDVFNFDQSDIRPARPAQSEASIFMHEVKDTGRAIVRIGYDGRVHKTFRGPKARERFETEVKVLLYLEKVGCDFVPRLLESDPKILMIVTTNCGSRVERLNEERMKELYNELETFGVRHEDAFLRNVTYRQQDGRFCLIDFEFATILDEEPSAPPRSDAG